MCRGCKSQKYNHLPICSCGLRFCKKNRVRIGYETKPKQKYCDYNKNPEYCEPKYCDPKPKYCPPKPKCDPIEDKYTLPIKEDRCPKDVGCFPNERQLTKCDLHSNYQPKDILVVDKKGQFQNSVLRKRALLPERSKDYVCSITNCLQENCKRRKYGGEECHLKDKKCESKFEVCENRYNITVCEPKEKCVDVELHFAVDYAGCEQICGQVKFDLCSTQRCGKKVTVTDLCPSKVFAKSPQKDDGRSNFFKLIFNDVPIGGDDTVLSFVRQALDCEEAMCGKDFEDNICITQICLYEK